MDYYKTDNESDIELVGLFSYVLSASSGKKVYSIFKVQIKKGYSQALCLVLYPYLHLFVFHLHLNYRAFSKACQAENFEKIKTC